MPSSRVVVIGASVGGIDALKRLCLNLPKDFAAPLCIVLHVGAYKSILPRILSSAGALRAVHPVDRQPLKNGCIFVAPPDQHMLIDGRRIRLFKGPKEHHSRPAIDPLFRSAARTLGSGIIGVVLTGMLNDGTAGLQSIKESGGICIVQDPLEAEAPSMPSSALNGVSVDHCVGVEDMASLLVRLIRQAPPRPDAVPTRERMIHEDNVFLGLGDPMEHLEAIGRPSTFSCPDCRGTLWQIAETKPRRFRCHTGHAFTLLTLESAQAQATDKALWSAIRSLQEESALLLIAKEAATTDGDLARAQQLDSRIEALRGAVSSVRSLAGDVPAAEA